MPTFELNVSWTESDIMTIEADSKEDAIQKAIDGDLPKGEYVDDSFQVDSCKEIK